jgi:hypothetical protein
MLIDSISESDVEGLLLRERLSDRDCWSDLDMVLEDVGRTDAECRVNDGVMVAVWDSVKDHDAVRSALRENDMVEDGEREIELLPCASDSERDRLLVRFGNESVRDVVFTTVKELDGCSGERETLRVPLELGWSVSVAEAVINTNVWDEIFCAVGVSSNSMVVETDVRVVVTVMLAADLVGSVVDEGDIDKEASLELENEWDMDAVGFCGESLFVGDLVGTEEVTERVGEPSVEVMDAWGLADFDTLVIVIDLVFQFVTDGVGVASVCSGDMLLVLLRERVADKTTCNEGVTMLLTVGDVVADTTVEADTLTLCEVVGVFETSCVDDDVAENDSVRDKDRDTSAVALGDTLMEAVGLIVSVSDCIVDADAVMVPRLVTVGKVAECECVATDVLE